ncbi:MAG: rRNA maturation RNAse YbeY, partial [Desulfobacterales bacterium]|nr:rRNA maturation RNAse YbeY [Desulfobacterales bacterium]
QLLIHGILHLFGYDHENSKEAADKMEKKSNELLGVLGGRPIF